MTRKCRIILLRFVTLVIQSLLIEFKIARFPRA